MHIRALNYLWDVGAAEQKEVVTVSRTLQCSWSKKLTDKARSDVHSYVKQEATQPFLGARATFVFTLYVSCLVQIMAGSAI